MPHSKPSRTSRASSFSRRKRFDRVVADHRLSRITRARPLRSTVPESTRQPAIVPTRLIVKDLLHQRPAQLDLALFGLEHALEGRLQVVGHL